MIFFNNRSKIALPFLNRNNFGGRISGPMPIPRFGEGGPAAYKDKGFFFFAYEGIRTRQSSLRTRTILTPSARQGVFTYNDTAGVQRTVNLPFAFYLPALELQRLTPPLTAVLFQNCQRQGIVPTLEISLIQPVIALTRNQMPTVTHTPRGWMWMLTKRTHSISFTAITKKITCALMWMATQGFNLIPDVIQSSENRQAVLSYRWTPVGRFTNEIRGGTFRSLVPFTNTAAVPAFYVNPTVISNPEVTFKNQGRKVWRNEFQG